MKNLEPSELKIVHHASRYIVDVAEAEQYIEIGDASKTKYYIDKSNQDVVKQFRSWFSNIFLKGIPGTLTLFRYKYVEFEGQFIANIEEIFVNNTQLIKENIK